MTRNIQHKRARNAGPFPLPRRFTFTGLTAGTQYDVKLRVRNANSCSNWFATTAVSNSRSRLSHSSLSCHACRSGPSLQVRLVPFADMPTVAREGPYRIFFYSNEGAEPMHVHVERDERVAKYWLTPVRLVKNGGFKRHELSDIENLVNRHKAVAEQKWVAHFGASPERS